MPGVRLKDGDAIERALKIFKKQVEKAGIIGDLKKKQQLTNKKTPEQHTKFFLR